MAVLCAVVMAVMTALLSPSATAATNAATDAASSAPREATGVTVPAGVTAGVAVFDRQTATFTEQLNPDMPFRSASVVKLLIALELPLEPRPGLPDLVR
ncbi:hypothetical protein ACIQJT_32940 [Streptomyces sp. NPDC091972]|uniref:hypothetical protein n=1 Tax=Streptomyces sp. NPDC091972 TaxID=3366007 RepID=UPI00381637BF